MSQNQRQVGLIVLLAAVAGTLGWNLWNGWRSGGSGGDRIDVHVLCSKCGHFGRADAADLSKVGGAARAPAFGPGYPCPKCGQRSLYANPIICEGCQTPFLVTVDANGAVQARCPKCGKTP